MSPIEEFWVQHTLKKKKKSFEVFCDGDSLCVLSIKSLREKCVVLNTGVWKYEKLQYNLFGKIQLVLKP